MSGPEDVLARARAMSPVIGELVEALLGCSWGRTIGTADDFDPCPEQAVRIVVLHAGDKQREVRMCAAHVARVGGLE